jgi:two-component system alkaline phosphatase synthesis response regulator PhoP
MAIIYAVEDDVHIGQLLYYSLKSAGHEVKVFESAEQFWSAVSKKRPEMVLMDVMLPGADGFETVKRLRNDSACRCLPLIMLTARGEESDKVRGLQIGADDYITKPFSVAELIARIDALMRRTSEMDSQTGERLIYKDLIIDIARHTVEKNGQQIAVTNKEFELLVLLVRGKGVVLTRDMLLDKVWGYDYAGETRTVDVHVKSLRKKIGDDPADPRYIMTVRGVGYRLFE